MGSKWICFIFVLVSGVLGAQENEDSLVNSSQSEEWEKFKSFENQLFESDHEKEQLKSQKLQAYIKDSLQILNVKLMAIKYLDEQHLLNRDIAENFEYYTALLVKLQESSIPKTEYLFLEEKLALQHQPVLERKLTQSRWALMALLVISFISLLWVLRARKRLQNNGKPELSKQEVKVQRLILQGKSNKEIANELFISLSTVKTHITNLYAKLNVASRKELLQKGYPY